MKIQFLGTAAAEGWPAIFCNCNICTEARKKGGKNLRTRTQSLIDDELLIDFPPDAYCHSIQHGINFAAIHHILITHSHMDHFFPVEIIHRHEHFAHEVTGKLNIYGNRSVEKALKDAMSIKRFDEFPIDNVLTFHYIEPYREFNIGKYRITPVLANHDKNEDCYIYIIKKDDKTMLYGHDTGILLSEDSWNCILKEKYHLVTLDCTMGEKKIEGYHMGIYDIPEFLQKLADSSAIDHYTIKVINHFSHNGNMSHDQLDAYAQKNGYLCTYDGMVVEF
ncbi:MAG: hypothetical protein GX962_06955 [Epulopiscium sp.]|nr:hypothetical protein [Candidatus Epulonipiscium sp.]